MARGNRYSRMKRNKRWMKRRHAVNTWSYRSIAASERYDRYWYEYYKDRGYDSHDRNGGYEYWKYYDCSSLKQDARYRTERRIRQKYRRLIQKMDHDECDLIAPRGSDYEKEFDYLWHIW